MTDKHTSGKIDGNTPLWTFLGMDAPDLSYVSSDNLISYESEARSMLCLSGTSKQKKGYAARILKLVEHARKLPEGEPRQSAARCAKIYIDFMRR